MGRNRNSRLQSNGIVVIAFALHVADPDLIPASHSLGLNRLL